MMKQGASARGSQKGKDCLNLLFATRFYAEIAGETHPKHANLRVTLKEQQQ